MATVLELITEALVTIKALAVGETPDASMTTDALNKFNEVLEALSLQNLAIYSSIDTVIPVLAGSMRIVLGPGGVSQRPISMNSIDTMYVNYDGVDFPIEVMPQEEYDYLPVKYTTGLPCMASYDNGYPNAVLSLYPVPERSCVIRISQRQLFTAATSLVDQFQMPAGYRRLVRLMLAWELSTDYPGLAGDDLAKLQKDVAGALGAVKRANTEPSILRSDVSLMSVSGGGWGDWREGS